MPFPFFPPFIFSFALPFPLAISGILFLICGQILKTADFLVLLSRLGLYIATVLVGHFLHAVIALPLIYFIVVRENPFRYVCGVFFGKGGGGWSLWRIPSAWLSTQDTAL